MQNRLFIAAMIIAAGSGMPARAESVVLTPVRDNSLIPTKDGSLSFGLSPFIFAGRVGNHAGGGTVRRGLIAFDLAAIPAGSTVESVELAVECTQTNTADMTVSLHRLLSDWGEGQSESPGGGGGPATRGDATWLHTFWPDQFWETPGGDYGASPSASTLIAFPGPYSWTSTPSLVADVQLWLDDPSQNFGWIVIGNEEIFQAVKALASRHFEIPEYIPRLTVTYTSPVTSVPGDVNGDGSVDGADLGLLLGAWGECPLRRECPADYNNDGVVDGADLGVLLGAWTD